MMAGKMVQPDPVPGDGPDVWQLVLADMAERRMFGVGKYGTPVHPFNGRDALQDAYEEVLDLAVYLRQLLEEGLSRST